MPLPLGVVASEGKSTSPYWITTRDYNTSNSYAKVAFDNSGNTYLAWVEGSNIIISKQGLRTDITWRKQFPGPGINQITSLSVDGSQNIYICLFDRILKLDINGTPIWYKTFTISAGSFGAVGAKLDSNNDIIVLLNVNINTTQNGVEITKLSGATGDLIWQQRYAHTNSGIVISSNGFTLDSSNNIYASAHWGSTSTSARYGSVVKFNSTGIPQFAKALYVNLTRRAFNNDQICVGTDGSIYYVGQAPSSSPASPTAPTTRRFVKWNSAGNLVWNTTIFYGNDPARIFGQAAGIDANNYFYTACSYNDSTISRSYLSIHKWDLNSSTPVWERRIEPGVAQIDQDFLATDLVNNTESYFAFSMTYGPSNKTAAYWKVPLDGSGTGTYPLDGVGWQYASASMTRGTETLPSDNLLQTYTTGSAFVNTTTLPTVTNGSQVMYSTLLNV